jgi:hypothetical protein
MIRPTPPLPTTEELLVLAADFWDRAGQPPPYPRNLEDVILLTTPVWVVRLEGLRPSGARLWLHRRGLELPLTVAERALDGCILAFRGRAVILLEATLDPEYDRVILAHEFAHYLAEYERPRLQIVRRLGEGVLPLLDGQRPATTPEVLAGTLAGVPLEAHMHFMERTFDPRCLAETARVERVANELACELLAPRQDVCEGMSRRGRLTAEPGPWQQLLTECFGFCLPWAEAYATRLIAWMNRQRSFTDILGL